MKFTKLIIFTLSFFIAIPFISNAQDKGEIHISKLELKKKEKKYFRDAERNPDSTLTIVIDTLVMRDKSSLQFQGLKDVKLIIKHADLGKSVYFSGISNKNNSSNFDIEINLQKLGSLYVIARGQDANNGMETDPNGNGGNVNFTYLSNGITPQTTNKKSEHYLGIETQGGGLFTNPTVELQRIYTQIKFSGAGLRGIPQGQIYSGTEGTTGKITIQSKINLD